MEDILNSQEIDAGEMQNLASITARLTPELTRVGKICMSFRKFTKPLAYNKFLEMGELPQQPLKAPGTEYVIAKKDKKQARIFTGEWIKKTKTPHGIGSLLKFDGSIFEGKFAQGEVKGYGRMIDPNGNLFEGVWEKGKFSGMGRIHKDGRKYEGDTLNELPHGDGKLTLPNGSTYIGQFVAGTMHGKGVFASPGKYTYKGEFREGVIDGIGRFEWVNGEAYEGEVAENEATGKGVYTWPDGKRYEGALEHRIRRGYGIMQYPDRSRYEGMWREDKKHGEGVLYLPYGIKQVGEWNNDRIVHCEEFSYRMPDPPKTVQRPSVFGEFDTSRPENLSFSQSAIVSMDVSSDEEDAEIQHLQQKSIAVEEPHGDSSPRLLDATLHLPEFDPVINSSSRKSVHRHRAGGSQASNSLKDSHPARLSPPPPQTEPAAAKQGTVPDPQKPIPLVLFDSVRPRKPSQPALQEAPPGSLFGPPVPVQKVTTNLPVIDERREPQVEEPVKGKPAPAVAVQQIPDPVVLSNPEKAPVNAVPPAPSTQSNPAIRPPQTVRKPQAKVSLFGNSPLNGGKASIKATLAPTAKVLDQSFLNESQNQESFNASISADSGKRPVVPVSKPKNEGVRPSMIVAPLADSQPEERKAAMSPPPVIEQKAAPTVPEAVAVPPPKEVRTAPFAAAEEKQPEFPKQPVSPPASIPEQRAVASPEEQAVPLECFPTPRFDTVLEAVPMAPRSPLEFKPVAYHIQKPTETLRLTRKDLEESSDIELEELTFEVPAPEEKPQAEAVEELVLSDPFAEALQSSPPLVFPATQQVQESGKPEGAESSHTSSCLSYALQGQAVDVSMGSGKGHKSSARPSEVDRPKVSKKAEESLDQLSSSNHSESQYDDLHFLNKIAASRSLNPGTFLQQGLLEKWGVLPHFPYRTLPQESEPPTVVMQWLKRPQGFYRGYLDENDRFTSFGVLLTADCIAEGQWVENQLHGLGRKTSLKSVMTGYWIRGHLHGFGTSLDSEVKSIYSGDWEHSECSGKGYKGSAERTYMGDFRRGVEHGSGVVVTREMRYEGEFAIGEVHGFGRAVFADGSQYVGAWSHGVVEGLGVRATRQQELFYGRVREGKNTTGEFLRNGERFKLSS